MDRTIMSVLKRIIKVIRYRFFIFAGIFPYLLGQITAFSAKRFLNWQNFWLGFLGIILVLIGVEFFNEYFDAKSGGDRVFLKEKPKIAHYFYPLGILVFILAFFIGLYFVFNVGWPILIFCLLGFLAAYFYVGPPFRWAYRGLGELAIAFSYGPFMVLGSYYLQTKRIDYLPIFVSLILGLLIFSLAIVNEIPDYFQDRLVGKRNMVVRLGKCNAAKFFTLSLVCVFILLGMGIGFRIMPLSVVLTFLALPFGFKSIKIANKYYDAPAFFLPAIKTAVFIYIIVVSSLAISYLNSAQA